MEKELVVERRQADGADKLAKLSQIAQHEQQSGMANVVNVKGQLGNDLSCDDHVFSTALQWTSF